MTGKPAPGDLPVPVGPEEITRDWLAAALHGRGVPATSADLVVDARPFGTDRGLTGCVARVSWSTGDGCAGTMIAKMPAARDDWLRCLREVRFYRELPGPAGLPLPRLLHAGVDEASRRIILLLEDVGGVDGDILAGCSPEAAALLLSTLAGMHASWWNDTRLENDWLPRWGGGTRGTAEPHARRAARYCKRIPTFLDWYGDVLAPGLREVIEALAVDLTTHLEVMTTQPLTLIHADLHLDNIAFDRMPAPTAAMILDWQSASRGPAVYDVVRLLTSTSKGQDSHAAFPGLIDGYRAALEAGGVPRAETARLSTAIRSTALCVLAGFVSGYGRRHPDSMQQRERSAVELATSSEGMGGLLMTILA